MLLENALLPKSRVAVAAVSSAAPYIENADLIRINDNFNIGSPVSSHADVNICCVGGGTVFVAAEQQSLAHKLSALGFNVIVLKEQMSGSYPGDSLLNAAVFGKTAILNPKTVSAELLTYLRDHSFQIIKTKQGYSKCSVFPIAKDAVITTDRAIAESCKKSDIDTLLICDEDIALSGYKNGLIGGCGGMIDTSTALFFGDIKTHRDYLRISNFLSSHMVNAVCTGGGKLTDCGSLIPLVSEN